MRSSTCGSMAASRVVMRTVPSLNACEGRYRDARPRGAAVLRRPQVAGDHDHVVRPGAGEVRRVANATVGVAMRERARLRSVLEVEQDAQDRMVEQVLADRTIGHDLDPEPVEPGARADAGALQHRRRMDRAGAQQHLAPRPHVAALAADRDANAVGMSAIALERQAVDDRVADDGEVGPPARRLEVAVVGRDAQARAAVDRVGRDAGAFGRVVVGAPAVAEAEACLHHRAVDMAPRLDRRAIDRDRAESCRDRARRRSRHRSPACRSTAAPRSSPSPRRPRAPSPRSRRGCRGSRSGR